MSDNVSHNNRLYYDLGALFFNIFGSPTSIDVSFTSAFTPGTDYRLTTIWDVNGIDGTSDTMRLLVDGVVEASSTATWSSPALGGQLFYFGQGTNPAQKAPLRGTIGSPILYNYAQASQAGVNTQYPRFCISRGGCSKGNAAMIFCNVSLRITTL